MKTRMIVISVLVMVMAGEGLADWPQWRGPKRDGTSAETGLLKEWPSDGPPLAWKAEKLGGGYGAPAVVGGRIFGMSNRRGQEAVWALSEKDGKELWVTGLGRVATGGMQQGSEGPGCTPTVDGELLYVVGASGTVACLRTEDGKVVWQRSLTRDLGGSAPRYRYNESPLVDGEKVICTPGGEDAAMVALDKRTGKTLWKTKVPAALARGPGGGPGRGSGAPGRRPGGPGRRPGGSDRRGGGPGRGPGGGDSHGSAAAYASAIAIDVAGQRQYVQSAANALIGVSASDGKLLWRYDRVANHRCISCATPLFHDGKVFATSAYGAGGGLVKLRADTDGGMKTEEVYFTSKMQNHHGGMILFDGCLYGASGGNEGGALACLDFRTGKVLWDRRDSGQRRGKGSLALADGRLYYRMESGTMVLIEPNAKQLVERGRFEQPDRSRRRAWAHPVIANGKLYLRDQDVLLCYDVKAK